MVNAVAYTLRGDRSIEYDYVYSNLLPGIGSLLDLGTPAGLPTSQFALKQGYHVVAVDLCGRSHENGDFEFRVGDFLEMEFAELFDWVLNISSIEHFGLAGRYGVTVEDVDADLKAMAKLQTLMKSDATMLLTIPVGQDVVVHPLHRVYGHQRLPQLLKGYRVVEKRFWGKQGDVDEYYSIDEEEALATKVQCRGVCSQLAGDHYYALGCFTLKLPRGRDHA